jgi:hypothetical protein
MEENEGENDEMSEKGQLSEGPLARFTRNTDKEGINPNPHLYAAMENFQACSVNDLRLILTKFQHLNAKNLFLKIPIPKFFS